MSTSRFRPRRHGAGRPAGDNRPRNPNQQNSQQNAAPYTPPPPPAPIDLESIAGSPFLGLGLTPPLVRAVMDEGYTVPTPVQTEVIPHILAGRDVLAGAQTGTGKTAAFVLPLLQRLFEGEGRPAAGTAGIRLLVLAPTRELASQINERVGAYGRHYGVRHAVLFGGVTQHRQEVALRQRPEVLIATPGRLLDLMKQGIVRLDKVQHYVLDEADRMLDMGFVRDVRTITAALPPGRQTLLFSATLAPVVASFAKSMLKDPVEVSIAPKTTTAPTVEQAVIFVSKPEKRALLMRILSERKVERAIVFTATKHGANRLAEQLAKGGITVAAIHGNKSQSARDRALDDFRRGTSRVLVATDVASRGIDVDGISHVVNFELPNTPESYVHRIGRAGRAGATGEALSFCDPANERGLLNDIEKLIRKRISVIPAGSWGDLREPREPSEGTRTASDLREGGSPRVQPGPVIRTPAAGATKGGPSTRSV